MFETEFVYFIEFMLANCVAYRAYTRHLLKFQKITPSTLFPTTVLVCVHSDRCYNNLMDTTTTGEKIFGRTRVLISSATNNEKQWPRESRGLNSKAFEPLFKYTQQTIVRCTNNRPRWYINERAFTFCGRVFSFNIRHDQGDFYLSDIGW